jgi:hypothetical protein
LDSSEKAEAPEGSERSVALELFLLSILSLYVELLAIRWMSADVRAFNIFRSFPLASCFIGLGAGYAAGNDKFFRIAPLALCFFAAALKLADIMGWVHYGFPTATNFQWSFDNNMDSLSYVLRFSAGLIILLAGPFAACLAIGSRLGVLFNEMRPLHAYSINLAGAFFGSILFTALVFLGCPPWQLILPCIPVLLFYLFKQLGKSYWQQALLVISLAALPFLAIEKEVKNASTIWSPYQRIDLSIYRLNSELAKLNKSDKHPDPTFIGLRIDVNRAFHQKFLRDDISDAVMKAMPIVAETVALRRLDYGLPYILKKSDDVLVVGAGTGQNVSYALRHGVKNVDGVEIDPQILKIGHKYNPDYAASNVNVSCDDARHFFNVCQKKYDLVNFSLLDSHSAVGQGSSVRIDSYVYTRESIQKAISLLKPNGLVVIAFDVFVPWVSDHLLSTVNEAAGYAPVVLRRTIRGRAEEDPVLFFVIGDAVKNGTLQIPPHFEAVPLETKTDPRLLTDDWPYLYVRSGLVDVPYLIVVGIIIALSATLGRKVVFTKPDAHSGQMFFLGAAFFLLELHAISLLSLLYGSTWLTSALVINGILAMIFLANLYVIKFGNLIERQQKVIYGILLTSIFASFFLPVNEVLSATAQSGFLGPLVVTVITILPMGVAGVIFANSFSKASNPARALSYNLFGALVGSLLEYTAIYSGVKSLELVSACLYLCSMLCFLRWSGSAASTPAAPSLPADQ